MRLRSLLLAGVGCATVLVVACGDFGSTPSTEASEAGADGTTADTGIGSPDGAAPKELDGGVDGKAAWVPCAQRPIDPAHFCDDFDFQGSITANWSGDQVISGNVGQTQIAFSAPRAFHAHTDDVATLPNRAQMFKNRPMTIDLATKKSIVLSFWMRVEGNPFAAGSEGSRYAHVAALEFDAPVCPTSGTSKQRMIELSFQAATSPPPLRLLTKGMRELCLPDAGGPEDWQSVVSLVDLAYFVGAYRHVTIDLQRTKACPGEATTGSVTLHIDGTTPKCLPATDPFLHGQSMRLALGQYIGSNKTAGAASFDVFYDNVTLDIE